MIVTPLVLSTLLGRGKTRKIGANWGGERPVGEGLIKERHYKGGGVLL